MKSWILANIGRLLLGSIVLLLAVIAIEIHSLPNRIGHAVWLNNRDSCGSYSDPCNIQGEVKIAR